MSAKLPALVQALLKPEAYPEHPDKIELLQTQMSFIFLTGVYAYKIKKPVNLGYLDYTTLEQRLFFCRQELELNCRLSPDAYLDVLPIINSDGQIRIGGKGTALEYAVKMRQLPQDRMMDKLLLREQVTKEMVAKVAEKMANFHARTATSPEISAYEGLDTIKINTLENFTQTEKYIEISISERKFGHIRNYTETFIEKNKTLFKKRVNDGKIKDCHGDLHAAHICFSNGIQIYDCIEFNDRFRYCDVASEIAFLAMDMDRYRRADLSQIFIDAYVQVSDDQELRKLLNFYKCYRAYVRGKVESFKYDDPYITNKEETLAAAKNYFDLAYLYSRDKPMLLIVTGLVGTGKTTVAQTLGRSTGFIVISSDVIRKKMAGVPLEEHRFENFQSGIYTREFSQKTYGEMLHQARGFLSAGQSVILDASFKKSQARLQAQKLAGEFNADFAVIECVADENTIKDRLEKRLEEGSVSDGRWDIFVEQKQDFDRITEIREQDHWILDTSQPLSDIINVIWERIGKL